VTVERDIEVERRLSALEERVSEIRRVLESKSVLVMNFVASAAGGIATGIVVWLLTRHP